MLTRVGRIRFCPMGIRKYVIKVAQIIRKANSASCIVGIVSQSRVIISFPENGADIANANRNIHFMNVTTEYLLISGLNIPRYNEKLKVLRISINIPNVVVSAAPPSDTLLTIR